jgi:hypothetical protein
MDVECIQAAPDSNFSSINTQWSAITDIFPSFTVGESLPWTANSAYGSKLNDSGTLTPAAMSASPHGHGDSYAWFDPPLFQFPAMFCEDNETMLHQYTAQDTEFPQMDPGTRITNSASIQAMELGDGKSVAHSTLVVPACQFCATYWNTFDAAFDSNVSIPAAPRQLMSGQ